MSRSSGVTLAFGVAGGALGNFIAPGIGGPIGFALGASLGSYLVPPQIDDQEGPRLDDLTVQGSAYGQPIPIIYGTHRIACNMIWTAGKKETKHTEDVGGKGQPSQEVTTYTYSMDAAWLICEGEITGIRKIWINNKLVYESGDDVTAATLNASISMADSVTIYPGSETQDPDPLMESYEGAGSVPAYRGVAYIVIDELQLAEFGNGTVNIEVEVVKSATEVDPPSVINTYSTFLSTSGNGGGQNGMIDNGIFRTNTWQLNTPSADHVEFTHRYIDLDTGEVLYRSIDDVTFDASISGDPSVHQPHNDPTVSLIAWHKNVGNQSKLWVFGRGQINPLTDVNNYFYHPFGGNDSRSWGGRDYPLSEVCRVGDYWYSQAYALTVNKRGIARWPRNETGIPQRTSDIAVRWQDIFTDPATSADRADQVIAAEEDDLIYVITDQSGPGEPYHLCQFDKDLNLLNTWNGDYTPALIGTSRCLFEGDYCFFSTNTGVQNIFRLYEFDHTTTDSSWTLLGSVTNSTSGNPYTIPLFGGMVTSVENIFYIYDLIPQGSQLLSDVVTDIVTKTDLTSGDIDVTDLTSYSVDGYLLSRGMSARSAIEPLQTAFFFDAALVDNKIEFIRRGGSSAKTISDDDLAAHPDGSTAPEVTEITRLGELELPKRVSVSYIEQESDYQVNEAHADRLTNHGTGISTINVPIVMNADDATQIADGLLYAQFAERESVVFYVSTKYLELAPGDVVTVGSNSLRVRIQEVDTTIINAIKITGVIDYSTAYTHTRTGSAGNASSTITGQVGPTLYYIADTPILRDQDDSAGFYLAANGFTSEWNGMGLYRSQDGGGTYSLMDTFIAGTTIGSSTDTLADGDTATWDYVNTVTVRLAAGSLASASELNVLNGSNAGFLGRDGWWEGIQWVTVTDNGDGTYTLSQLLRGRKGTEHNTANHETGDQFFVATETTIKRFDIQSSEIDVERLYKGVSIGNLIQNVDPISNTNAGVALKPLSPVFIRGERDGSNNLTITWLRRSRYNYTYLYDLPLGEDSESYEIDIVGASPARTITASSETASYTAAQQTTDGFTPGDPIEVNIYQISATVDRGYAGNATI